MFFGMMYYVISILCNFLLTLLIPIFFYKILYKVQQNFGFKKMKISDVAYQQQTITTESIFCFCYINLNVVSILNKI